MLGIEDDDVDGLAKEIGVYILCQLARLWGRARRQEWRMGGPDAEEEHFSQASNDTDDERPVGDLQDSLADGDDANPFADAHEAGFM